jgi:glycosyltransferase involved in cell wall biosynthesis
LDNERPLLLDVSRLIWRRWVGRLPTGIDRVCLAYLEHFRERSQAVVQRSGYRRILSVKASDRLFSVLLHPAPNLRREITQVLTRDRLFRIRQLRGARRPYINVGHTALHDPRYLTWTRSADVRAVYMVHDLIPITHPEYCRPGEAQRHSSRIRNMLASASGIIGNSQATLASLAAFARVENLPLPALLSAPLGNDLETRRHCSTDRAARPTYVVLGTIEGRKNHLLLLKIWSDLVAELGPEAPRLLIIGQRGWQCDEVFAMLDGRADLKMAVEEVGQCDDAELVSHLSGATALLFPSLVEGYGLPLIEALASGTPVIASDLPVFHEIGHDIPDFISPHDRAGWMEAIRDYASPGSTARKAQLKRLTNYKAPTWSDHFTAVDQWLATL